MKILSAWALFAPADLTCDQHSLLRFRDLRTGAVARLLEEMECMRTSSWNDPGFLAGGVWACLALLLPFSGVALAQDRPAASPLRIELNRIEAAGENCRTYFLIDNQKGENWRSLKLDLFALDTDGVAAKRLAVEVGPVPSRKTLIKLFDFPGLNCSRFGRVLLNDVLTCEGATNSREECLSGIETASKIEAVSFVK
jgi:hypothetical protein